MLRHQSVATIDNPEFINLQPLDISPLISSCDIKVLYIDENRNRTFISKETAEEMAKTLRGTPIVGCYKEEKGDFGDHGHRVIFEEGEVKFECTTQPYGFVAPDAPVWFQKFKETNPLGQEVERTYLMTKGYLWTGQFEEAQKILDDGGKGQSMELGDDMKGEWYTKENGVDLFIISDAIFSKLCILGDDVEPCFEGASITKEYSSIDKSFTATLYSMMNELKEVLSKGGQDSMEDNKEFTTEEPVIDTPVEEPVTEEQPVVEENPVGASEEPAADFEKKDDDEKKDDENKQDDDTSKDDDDEDDEKEKKYQLMEEELTALKAQYSALETQYNELVEYKKAVEDAKKDELIKSFYFLSDEDKADVIAHKSDYSLEDIEAKLSVICVRNRVSFSLDENKKETEDVKGPATYSLDSLVADTDNTPEWVKFASTMSV